MTSPADAAPRPVTNPLALAALETERYVAASGWDQPIRLFALVPTSDLVEREPHLHSGLSRSDQVEGALSAIEQDGLPDSESIESLLAQIGWPDTVAGCAIAIERLVVPPEAERDLPEEPTAALEALASHPDRQDVRLLVAVHRSGERVCLLRQRAHDRDDQVASSSDLAPGLIEALRSTLVGEASAPS